MGLNDTIKTWDIYNAKVYFEDNLDYVIRPVLVVDEINQIVLSIKITKNTKRIGIDEYTIKKWKEAGLDVESNLRLSKLLTFKKDMFQDKRGVLQVEDRKEVIRQMKIFLMLNNTRYTASLIDILEKRINYNIEK